MPIIEWKSFVFVVVIGLRFVRCNVISEDEETSEMEPKTYTKQGRVSGNSREVEPMICAFAYSAEPIAEAMAIVPPRTIMGKSEQSKKEISTNRTNANLQDEKNGSSESKVRFLNATEKSNETRLPSALHESAVGSDVNKSNKGEPVYMQNEKEDENQESESEIPEKETQDTRKGKEDFEESDTMENDEETDDVTPEKVTIGNFACNETFYNAWNLLRLRCGGNNLNITSAVQSTQCTVYTGKQTLYQNSFTQDIKLCISTCRIPACIRNRWEYTVSNGLESPVYHNVNYLQLLRRAKIPIFATSRQLNVSQIASKRPPTAIFENLNLSSVSTCNSNISVQCACNFDNSSDTNDKTLKSGQEDLFQPPVDRGFENWNRWSDGVEKTAMDKAGITSAKVGQTAAAVSVALSGAITVVTGVLGTTSTTLAATVSAGAGVGLTVAAMDLCQFSVMINQLNLQARPRFLEKMGEEMSFSTFAFLPFGEVKRVRNAESDRRLSESEIGAVGAMKGMERYARVIGIQVDMLFYVTLGGIGVICCVPWVGYMILVLFVSPCVRAPSKFRRQWLDKTIGVFILIVMLTQYVIGVTATFQICLCIQRNHMNDPRIVIATITLLVCSLGTLAFGYHVLTTHQDELKDVGTQAHLSKPVYVRYGPLYEEYRYESRYFFAPKLLLAILSGMTTGTIFIHGWVQLVILIVLHGFFFILLEYKHPYPSHLIQKTTSFVIFIKMSVLGLSFFLLSTTFESLKLPFDLRRSIGFTILGLEVLVLCCLLFRQFFVFYRTWKIRRDGPKTKCHTVAYSTRQEEREVVYTCEPYTLKEREIEYTYDPYMLREREMAREMQWIERPVDHHSKTYPPPEQLDRLREAPKVCAEPLKEWRRT
uniref:Uncharacterized protein AlNc14C125G6784 n=1 Tax=Albugo laibachii Nc14 TaxID=890382 RepID=F0WJQ8_9STRA|nr:conserved hypothetical protein [Albugo laibachii Nc14]|eukprot:CCA21509.1 conserved hypothetical protein [Albugo laibachii Nc14]